ncbi:MAG TPA: hypothetical protein VFF80_04670 [Bacillota bacterium]|nr:hypothetical protein [Bacillota bacterium]
MQEEELKVVLELHLQRYPLMQIRDAVKLLYQNEFGGGHLIPDAEQSLGFLLREWDSVAADQQASAFEEIGSGLVRASLPALKARAVAPELLNRVFVLSANAVQGSISEFERKLPTLRTCRVQNAVAFDSAVLAEYLEEYRRQGYPAVSHSEIYRQAYHPSYRVLLKQFWLEAQ